MRIQVQSLALLRVLRIWRCYELCIGHRCGVDPELLWLWCRPTAVSMIQPLAWELSYAASTALEKKKKYLSSNNVPLIFSHFPQELLGQVLLFFIQTALTLKLLEFQVFKVFALNIQQISILC